MPNLLCMQYDCLLNPSLFFPIAVSCAMDVDYCRLCIKIICHSSSLFHYPFLSSNSRARPGKVFTYDHCFDAEGQSSQQEAVYQAVGRGLLDNAFDGYNACILAYGQTGEWSVCVVWPMDRQVSQLCVSPALWTDRWISCVCRLAYGQTGESAVCVIWPMGRQVRQLWASLGLRTDRWDSCVCCLAYGQIGESAVCAACSLDR